MAYSRLTLSTLEGTRKTLARLTRELYNGKLRESMELQEIRLCIDAAKAVLQGHKAEAELKVADEIAGIREALKRKGLL